MPISLNYLMKKYENCNSRHTSLKNNVRILRISWADDSWSGVKASLLNFNCVIYFNVIVKPLTFIVEMRSSVKLSVIQATA